MATLFNTKISETYEGLLKTIDNAAISATLKELTDGSGNQSGLYLNTAGDFKVSNILEWGSLKDTGTGVTITRYVTSTDGLENFDNNTSLPTSAAVKLYVDTKFSQTDTLTEVLGFGNTTSGKDILVSAGDDITFTDTSKALFGTGQDLEVNHDGFDSFITDLGTGNLRLRSDDSVRIQASTGGNTLGTFTKGAGVDLYFNNVKKFETTLLGSTVTGDLLVTGTITGAGGSFLPLAGGTMTGSIVLNDNVKTSYGTSTDFEIFHNASTNSNFIQSNLSRQLILAQDNIFIGNQAASESMITAIADGAVSLYYDNAKKFETTNTGVSVTGALTTTTDVSVGANATFVDGGKAIFGASSDLEIYHDGSNSIIKDGGLGNLYVYSDQFIINNFPDTQNMARFVSGGAATLYYAGSEKFETLTDGAKVTGNLEVTGTITGAGGSFLPLIGGTMTGNTIHNDNVKSIYGTASDGLEIYHDGSNSYVSDTGTGTLNLRGSTQVLISGVNGQVGVQYIEGGAVNLRHNNAQKLSTTNTGISVTGDGVFTGDILLGDDKFVELGAGRDFIIGHNGSDALVRNYTGTLYIDQAAVTQSTVFRVSNANSLDTTALTISRNGDLTTGRDVTIAGDLTVNGTTTTVNSQTLAVVDPLIQLAKDNTANSLDIGLYGDYNDGTGRYLGLFSDASDSNKFKLFKGLTLEPTTTVNIGGAGYVAADLQVAGFEATTGTFTGNVTSNSTTAFSVGTIGSIGNTANDINIYSTTTGHNGLRMHANGILPTDNTGTIIDNDADLGEASYRFKNLYLGSEIISGGGATFGGDVILNNSDIDFKYSDNVQYYRVGLGASANFEIYNTNYSRTDLLITQSTGDATFAGDVTIDTNANALLTLDGGASSTEGIIIKQAGTEVSRISHSNSTSLVFSTGSSVTTALTLSSSQNATFAGDVNLTNGIIQATHDSNYVAKFINTATSMSNNNYTLMVDSSSHVSNMSSAGAMAVDVNSGRAFTITGAGNVGIGTDSPNAKLEVASGGGIHISDDALGRTLIIKPSLTGQVHEFTSDNTSAGYSFSNNSSELMRISNSGKLGIGTGGGTPTFKLQVNSTDASDNVAYIHHNNAAQSSGDVLKVRSDAGDNSGSALLNVQNNSGSALYVRGDRNVGIGTDSPDTTLEVSGSNSDTTLSITESTNDNYLQFLQQSSNSYIIAGTKTGTATQSLITYTGGSERMRITSGGDVLIGKTSTSNAISGLNLSNNTAWGGLIKYSRINAATTQYHSIFYKSTGGIIGSISTTDTATSYNTSSDYRLKEDLQDFAGLDMVSKIPVYDYKWKADESRSFGVMAHELQEVLPNAVSGEKDAEEMQGVDYSKIVPLLIKSIQELKAEIDILKSQNCKCKN